MSQHENHHQPHHGNDHDTATAVLEVSGVQWATSKNVAEAVLGRRPGVLTRGREPRQPDRDRGLRPSPDRPGASCAAGCGTAASTAQGSRCRTTSATRWPSRPPSPTTAGPPPGAPARARRRPRSRAEVSPHEAMGHGGHGAMSMADMVADMRNRFLVAAVLSVPVLLWSPIGREVLGFDAAGAVRAARRRVQPAAVACR